MDIRSGDVLLFLAMVFVFATIFSIGVIILLTYTKVVRIKQPVEYITWGIVGGILISFIYVTLMCNKSSSEHVEVTSCRLQVTGFPVAGYRLPVTGNRQPVTGNIPATCNL